jgi:pimeloyl-ACP methyl ester carboxylesterase
MKIEALESRRLFSSDISLYSADGSSGAVINRHLALFVLVHGNDMTVSEMVDMATAVKDQLPANQYQVLIVDWNQNVDALTIGSELAQTIQVSHIPTSRVNLIGYSLGGTVIGRTARDLKTKTSEVNRIIAIDPASSKLEAANYAADSEYSIAFCGNDGYAHTASSLSADDTVLLTGLSGDDLDRHAEVFTLVNNMWDDDADSSSLGDQAIDSLFSINTILRGKPAPWKANAFYSGFEAIMPCNENGGNSFPLSLTYDNSRGHTITID